MGESKTVHSALVTYISMISLLTLCPPFVVLLSGIFDPAVVYDHLGEIYATLVVGSFVFYIFLYIKFLPYFYVLFLTILLFNRAKRDDDRCSSKYGKYWKMYHEKVPYRIIPVIDGVFLVGRHKNNLHSQ